MPRLHLMHGFIGAGKTTYARQLELKLPALRLTQDEWMIARHGTNPPADQFEKYERRLKGLLWRWAKAELAHGRDVILDYGFWSRPSRDAIRGMAGEIGVEPVFYAPRVTRDEMLARTLARTAAMPAGALFIDEAAFNLFWQRYQPLEADETAIYF